jgi:hypothetical protein
VQPYYRWAGCARRCQDVHHQPDHQRRLLRWWPMLPSCHRCSRSPGLPSQRCGLAALFDFREMVFQRFP